MNLSILKYIAFNAMTVGTVALATVYKVDAIIMVSTWFYAFEAIMFLIIALCSANDDFWEEFLSKPEMLVPWKAIAEPGLVIYMFSLGHVFNGVCMAFTSLAYTYLVICKYAKKSRPEM